MKEKLSTYIRAARSGNSAVMNQLRTDNSGDSRFIAIADRMDDRITRKIRSRN